MQSTRSGVFLIAATVAAVASVGCGGHSGGSRAPLGSTSPGTTAPVSTAVSARTLAKGDLSDLRGTPASATVERVATSDAAWAALWAEHQQASPTTAPVVDTTREQVVGVFLGERATAGWGVEIVGVAEVSSAGQTLIEVSYAASYPAPAAPAQTCAPFHLVAIDRPGAPVVFVDVSVAPPVNPVTGLHGELVLAPSLAGGAPALAFLQDGRADALEVVDPQALLAQGIHDGHTLTVDGQDEPNVGGSSALPRALRLSGFAVDDVVLTGRLETLRVLAPPPPVVLRSNGAVWEPIGPQAAAFLQETQHVPLRVFGRIDKTHVGRYGTGLVVTAWHAAVEVGLSAVRPLIGYSNFQIEDLARGAYRVESTDVLGPTLREVRGSGRQLDPADRAALASAVAAADLRSRPSSYRPSQVYPDHPSKTLRFADAQGEVTVTIWAGATGVPRDVTALVNALEALAARVPVLRSLEQGQQSAIVTPQVSVSRDGRGFRALYAQHAPGSATLPRVDFTQELVVAAFMGQQTTGGYAIELQDLERIGSVVHLVTRRTAPTGAAPSVLTAPYHLAAVVNHAGDVYVDGARR